jgi:hypothetical protein
MALPIGGARDRLPPGEGFRLPCAPRSRRSAKRNKGVQLVCSSIRPPLAQ